MKSRRIVVTGMGIVSPLGCGIEHVWQRLLAGQSGLRKLPEELIASLPAKIGGVVPAKAEDEAAGFDPDMLVAPKEQRKMDRFIQFALAAAEEAVIQAGWVNITESEKERTATIIASGIGGFPAITNAVRTTDQRGAKAPACWSSKTCNMHLPGERSHSQKSWGMVPAPTLTT